MKTKFLKTEGKPDSQPRLVGIDKVVPDKVDMSKRGWLRACDAGIAPWGVKVGGRRLWNLDEIDEWVRQGCPKVDGSGR